VAALLLIVFVVVTYVPLGGPDGEGVLNVTLHSGKIEANNNLNSTSSVMAPSNGRVAMARVAVVNRSDHRVMRRVATDVADRIAATDAIDTVDAFDMASGDDWPNDGRRLYDLYIVLDMPEFDSSGLLATGRTVDAKVTANVGNDLWDSRHGYSDALTPPMVRINCSISLDHHSVSSGYESANAKYTQVIDNIADQLAGDLEKKLAKWAADHPLMSDVPGGLYPTYRPAPDDLPLPDAAELERVISGNGLMLHNRTVWTMHTDRPAEMLNDLAGRLEAAGWRTGDPNITADDRWSHHLRASRDAQVYEAFVVQPRMMTFAEPDANEAVRLVVDYRDRMTRDETGAVLEQMLEANAISIPTMLQFRTVMGNDLRERCVQRMLEAKGLPAAAQLMVIRHLHQRGRTGEAIARLDDAHLAVLLDPDGDTDAAVKLAKEVTGHDDWKPTGPTEEQLRRMGAQPVEPGATLEAEVALNQPALFYHQAPETDVNLGPMVLAAVTVTPSKIPEGDYTLNLAKVSMPGGRRGQSSSTPHGHERPWSCVHAHGYNDMDWYVTADEIGPDRFRITFRVQVDEPQPAAP